MAKNINYLSLFTRAGKLAIVFKLFEPKPAQNVKSKVKIHPNPTASTLKCWAFDDYSNSDELFVFEHDSDAWISWQYIIFTSASSAMFKR